MSPCVVIVVFVLSLLFMVFSLAPVLTNSPNADALDTFSSLEMGTAAIIHA